MSVQIFREALCREINVPDIALDTPFAHLDVDAAVVFAVLAQVEESTGITFPASLFRDCTCLADLEKRLSTSALSIREAARESSQLVKDFAAAAGTTDYWPSVASDQHRLVIAYIWEALKQLGCPLDIMPAGSKVVPPTVQPSHQQLLDTLFEILIQEGLIERVNSDHLVRTKVPLPSSSAAILHERILLDHPRHANTHRLLHLTAPRLADCLVGNADPIRLLFGSPVGRDLLQDFYTRAPMSMAASQQLAALFQRVFEPLKQSTSDPIEILEVGAGFGGTTGFILDALVAAGVPFRYTFTDVSASFFKTARQHYRTSDMPVSFEVLDIETVAGPPSHLQGRFHAVLSTNCLHATRDLAVSAANARRLLRPDVPGAFLALIEFTERIFWLDLVFGLLDGWWRFTDGRRHCVAGEGFWKQSLVKAGFGQVVFTEGNVEGKKPNPEVIVAW
ncbi:hypothetical protein ASPZODRAFT_14344 [Penicilliopsis zonata CBS 506.65]|uniref:Carrier domain-containing protein n=1 Tax=Penicilliopsis zonata CBS 506.65 TaxID=1073090 RepID=A0A1L9SLU9_9EURO|nr:hypothetical protein ASPZODRAFT_14344 [Penicilliopsis zonata CBS 506.65]OJJ48195.1 hypothetical protein ASPZODRAFT_14344 [Penicilliopsis zonata CBS 506.65]